MRMTDMFAGRFFFEREKRDQNKKRRRHKPDKPHLQLNGEAAAWAGAEGGPWVLHNILLGQEMLVACTLLPLQQALCLPLTQGRKAPGHTYWQ